MVIDTVGVGGEFHIWPRAVVRGRANLPTRRWRSPYTEVLSSLHGGFGFPTRRNGALCAVLHKLQVK